MATITSQILAGADDGTWHNEGAGSISAGSSLIRIGDADSLDFNRSAWLRFTNITVPAGATITAASIQVRAVGLSGAIPAMTIDGNDIDNAVAPTSRSQVNALAHTSAAVSWTPPSWTATLPYTTSNLSTIIQEIVDRPGWSSGNAMLLFMKDTNTSNVVGQISFDAFEGSPANAAILSVTYDSGVTPTANAGPDQSSVESQAQVTLSGAGSTGSPTVYQWRQISGTTAALSSTSVVSPTFTAPATADGDVLTFGLRVGNGGPLSAEDTVAVTVQPHTEWIIRGGVPVPVLGKVRRGGGWV